MELFSEEKKKEIEIQPLALRMSPRTLDEFIGQEHILGKGKLLRRAIEADRISSLILFGPPGSGKSALAKIIASRTQAYFVELNAVSIGVETIRQEVTRALERKQISNKKTILLIDEIHHFNKLQQDALLPDVEKGNVILIGITTENPYFYVNQGIISRSLVFEFYPLKENDLEIIIKNALQDKEHGLGNLKIEMFPEALNHLIKTAEGDARRALNALEIGALTTSPNNQEVINFDLTIAEESIQKKAVLYDKHGDEHYDTISAYIKSLRGSDPDAALYWLAKMLYAGEDPRFIARRLIIAASEDVGNADPQALSIATSALQAIEFVGMPEAKIPLAQATVYIACAPKSNASYLAIEKAWEEVEKKKVVPVPNYLKDAHLNGEGRRGHGVGYKYPHDYPGHFVQQKYLPEEKKFYSPTDIGYEKEIKKRLENIRPLGKEKNSKLNIGGNVRSEKVKLRKEVLLERNKLTPEEIAKKSRTIAEKLFSLDEFIKAKTILFFASFGTEVETQSLIGKSLIQGKRVILPRVNKDKKKLDLYEIKDLKKLIPGSYGIPEPDPSQATLIEPEEIDLVIVPGIVFDEKGNRIGYGGGYYDRLLRKISRYKKTSFIGVAFDFQVRQTIPQEAVDRQLNFVVTEKRIITLPLKGGCKK